MSKIRGPISALFPKRAALSLTSWFCIPEQEMKDLEVLCRASAFLIKSTNKNFHSKFHVVSVSHAIAPWKWPKLYSDEWLQFVNEKHTYHTVELRYQDGVLETQADLKPIVFHHPTRDLSVMHLDDEDEMVSVFESLSFFPHIELNHNVLKESQTLQFRGHELKDAEFGNNNFEDRLPFPKSVNGFIRGSSKFQTFAKTQKVLVDGMCGGPVFVTPSGGNISSVSEWKLAGMLEGIVPEDHPSPELSGTAVFVESETIKKFLDQIEAGEVEGLKTGEIAFKTLQEDSDEAKMDLQSILEGKNMRKKK